MQIMTTAVPVNQSSAFCIVSLKRRYYTLQNEREKTTKLTLLLKIHLWNQSPAGGKKKKISKPIKREHCGKFNKFSGMKPMPLTKHPDLKAPNDL